MAELLTGIGLGDCHQPHTNPPLPTLPKPHAANASRAPDETYPRPLRPMTLSPHSASYAARTQGRVEWPVDGGACPGGDMNAAAVPEIRVTPEPDPLTTPDP